MNYQELYDKLGKLLQENPERGKQDALFVIDRDTIDTTEDYLALDISDIALSETTQEFDNGVVIKKRDVFFQ